MNHDDMGRDDDIMDPDVSKAYRATATEQAPAHLDKAVLRDAHRGAQASRGPMLRWRRPLAWAATIALSFALLLEVTQQSPDLEPPTALDEADLSAESRPANAVDAAAYDSDEPSASEPSRALEESVVTTNAPQEAAVQSEAAKRDRLRELETMSSPRASGGDMASQKVMPAAPVAAEAEAFQDAASASAAAVAKEEQSLALDSVAAGARASTTLEKAQACGNDVREDREAWRQCILDLREAGRLEEARDEATLFNERHPDEDLPDWQR